MHLSRFPTKIKCHQQKSVVMDAPKKIKVLHDTNQIRERVQEIGNEITRDFRGEKVHLVGVLKGSFMFYADLVRSIDLPVVCDFIQACSYGNKATSSGVVDLRVDLQHDVQNQHVVIVEDIIDTGYTMEKLLDYMRRKNPKTVSVCTLLYKPSAIKVAVPLDYVGFNIPNDFVIGYGLDFAEMYRNLPYIGVLEQNKTI